MSTPETAIPAAPAAPTPAPVTPAAPQIGAATDAKSIAKQSLFQSMGAAREAALAATPQATPQTTPAETPAVVLDATGRAHAADGKYVAAPAATPATPPVQKAPEGIRIPVPDGHWLREQGATEWVARNEAEARQVRGLFNDAARRSEVGTLREQLVTAQSQLKAAQEARQRIVAAPELLADIQYLRSSEVNRPDLADAIVAGLEAKQAEKARGYEAEARQQFTEQDAIAEVTTFRDTTMEVAARRYPDFFVNSPGFVLACRRALYQHANEVAVKEQNGQDAKLSLEGVWNYLDVLYSKDPYAQQGMRQRMQARKPPAPVASDAQARHATNSPLSVLPSAVRTDRLSTTPAAMDFTGMSVDQIKRQLKGELIYGKPA